MTPKEKAESLLRHMTVDFSIDLWQSKQCALVAVDEIIEFMKNDDSDSDTCYWANHPKMKYYQEVKQELKNI